MSMWLPILIGFRYTVYFELGFNCISIWISISVACGTQCVSLWIAIAYWFVCCVDFDCGCKFNFELDFWFNSMWISRIHRPNVQMSCNMEFNVNSILIAFGFRHGCHVYPVMDYNLMPISISNIFRFGLQVNVGLDLNSMLTSILDWCVSPGHFDSYFNFSPSWMTVLCR